MRGRSVSYRRRNLAGALLGALLVCSPARASAQARDLDIWIDTNRDGLPGPYRGNFRPAGYLDSIVVYIDSHEFMWTNFLCYLSFGDPAGPSYFPTDTSSVRVTYGVSGGLVFPEDNFSLPNTFGIGGFGFTERSGIVRLATVTFPISAGVSSGTNAVCIRPIVTSDNEASVMSALGNGSAYGVFDEGRVTGACFTIHGIDGGPTGVRIVPDDPSLVVGDSIAFYAEGKYWDAGPPDLTRVIEWGSSDPSVATIDTNGVARGVSPGAAVIHARGSPIRDSTLVSVVVSPPRLLAVNVTPADTALAAGLDVALTAIGQYDVLPPRDITERVTWSVSDTAIAAVTTKGTARARAPGVASVRATQDGVFGEMTLTVTAAALTFLGVRPPSASMPLGTTFPYRAFASYTDGTTRDVTEGTSWSMEDEGVAVIGDDGVVTARVVGTSRIRAQREGRTATAQLRVLDSLVVSTPEGRWFVGAPESVSWSAPGPVDIDLTADGGTTYVALARNVSASPHRMRVPRGPSAVARLRVSVRLEETVFSVESDPFPIAADIALTAMEVDETDEGGVRLRWTTDPAPPVISAYRIERAIPGGEFASVGGEVTTSSFIDANPVAGAQYRLIARNGLGDESVLATRSLGPVLLGTRDLVVFPNPAPRGHATILFRVPASSAGPESAVRTTMSVFDVTGRRVRALIDGSFSPGRREIRWDGRNADGAPVAPGVYLLDVRSEPAHTARARILVVR